MLKSFHKRAQPDMLQKLTCTVLELKGKKDLQKKSLTLNTMMQKQGIFLTGLSWCNKLISYLRREPESVAWNERKVTHLPSTTANKDNQGILGINKSRTNFKPWLG